MTIYLHDIPLDKATESFSESLRTAELDGILGEEELLLDEDAVGRVLARAVWAEICSPHYHASAMDGFAVLAADTDGAMPTNPVTLLYGEQALYVDTGDVLPSEMNAVIPIENVEPLESNGGVSVDIRSPNAIRIRSAAPPWQHVRPLGEDIVATQLVLPAGHTLRPVDMGAIAACGHESVRAARKPRVAIIPTGTELVPVGAELKPGGIIEYNSIVLAGQVKQWGGAPNRFPIVIDELRLISEKVAEAAVDHDLILLSAGSSAGSEDFSAQVVQQLGELLVHGVAVRPGHPVILGMIHKSQLAGDQPKFVPIIGVPGYPVSAALTGEIFVKPLIERWLGKQASTPMRIKAKITRKVTSPAGDDDFMRVAVGRVGDKVLAAPLQRGAGVISSLVRADGIVVIPRGTQGLPAGTEVDVQLYRSIDEIDRTIFAIGSHDVSLDLIAQYLATRGRRLTSANVGSLSGLVALRRDETHIAGSHLLDPDTGEYNLSYIGEYVPGRDLHVVELVRREQGLMVNPENPKNIRGLQDLTRPDIQFINRQRGAGTRVLLDYHLQRQGITSGDIAGYEKEEYTHLSLAAAISSGRADCGLGIAAAAQALGLDFLPLYSERYDLVIPSEYYCGKLLAPLLEILHEDEFKKDVSRLPGYDTARMGDLVAVISQR
jgi:putative molybdopterin biosynthesis protein